MVVGLVTEVFIFMRWEIVWSKNWAPNLRSVHAPGFSSANYSIRFLLEELKLNSTLNYRFKNLLRLNCIKLRTFTKVSPYRLEHHYDHAFVMGYKPEEGFACAKRNHSFLLRGRHVHRKNNHGWREQKSPFIKSKKRTMEKSRREHRVQMRYLCRKASPQTFVVWGNFVL